MESISGLRTYLNLLVSSFEKPEFIEKDPIIIPHSFEDPLDQEVIGLYSALLAWGQRKTLLKNLKNYAK